MTVTASVSNSTPLERDAQLVSARDESIVAVSVRSGSTPSA